MKRPAKILAGTLILLYFYWAVGRAADAQAHLLRLPDSPTKSVLENREASQAENLKHARYVARNGARANQRWHRQAVRWISSELAQTREQLALRERSKITGMWYEIAVCESGSRPPDWSINTGNGYYGGLQFDYGTWHEAMGNLGVNWTAYAHQAAPWQQVKAASTLPLSRWPVCGRPYR